MRNREEKLEITKTQDGSDTLYVPELDEYYHSIYGAIQESMHVFIKHGFFTVYKEVVSILEIGFGTGLNALLTHLMAEKQKKKIRYETVELNPLGDNIIEKLNYCRLLRCEDTNLFQKIHQVEWGKIIELSPFFFMHKILQDFNIFNPERKYDLIYFDAFSPEKQAEMWSEANFMKLYSSMNDGGILVTYSAKGKVQRKLKRIGFTVNMLEGPPGKHEMIRASKQGKF